MKIPYYSVPLILLMAIFQSSCFGEPQSEAWRALKDMNVKDFFSDPGQVIFAEAIAQQDAARISELIKQGSNVNFVGQNGMRPLFWAMANNSVNIFELLLQNGADANVTAEGLLKNGRPVSVMELAAIAETPEYLRLALKHGGNPNFLVGYGNRTIIYEAIRSNRLENVRTLIEAGVNLSQQDTVGETPMMIAAAINHYDVVYLFLMKGANPLLKNRGGFDLAGRMKKYGSRGIDPGSEQYQWYLKVAEELKKRGLLDEP